MLLAGIEAFGAEQRPACRPGLLVQRVRFRDLYLRENEIQIGSDVGNHFSPQRTQ